MEHFKKLNAIDCNGKTEKKNGLTYLSWTYAWENVKKHYPEATYKVIKFNNLPYMFDEKTGYMVFTEVTIEGIAHEMWLPVMDGANKAMKDKPYTYEVTKWENNKKIKVEKSVETATMFDINKTIMRCLTKNLAMFGMGLYIYSGEDLPEVEKPEPKQDDKPEPKQDNKPEPKQASGKNVTKFELTENQIKRLWAIAKASGVSEERVHEVIKSEYKKESVKELSKTEYDKVCKSLEAKKSKEA